MNIQHWPFLPALLTLFCSAWVAPAQTQPVHEPVALRRQAENLMDAGKYMDSIRLFNASIASRPTARAYEGRGLSHFELGEYQQAIDDYDKALQLSPNKASTHFNRAAAYIKLGENNKAIDDLSRALLLDPSRAAIYLNQRGLLYATVGDYQKSVEDFDAAIKVRPDYRTYQENRAAAARKLSEQKSKLALEQVSKTLRQQQLAERAGDAARQSLEASGKQRSNRPVRDKWALVIGISKFKNPQMNLQYPAKDAGDFADFLVRQANFKADHVKVLIDEQASRENILALLGQDWLPKLVQEDDLVVFYFSSHGSPSDLDHVGVNYLVAHDTNPNNLFATGIPMQDLADTIKRRLKSDRIVLFLDACHSGSASVASKGLVRHYNVNAEEIAQGSGQLVICSSDRNERSWESKHYANGVFTHWLIESLRKDGEKTSLGDAFDYMKEKVHDEVYKDRSVSQTPVLKSKWQGRDLLLCVPSAR